MVQCPCCVRLPLCKARRRPGGLTPLVVHQGVSAVEHVCKHSLALCFLATRARVVQGGPQSSSSSNFRDNQPVQTGRMHGSRALPHTTKARRFRVTLLCWPCRIGLSVHQHPPPVSTAAAAACNCCRFGCAPHYTILKSQQTLACFTRPTDTPARTAVADCRRLQTSGCKLSCWVWSGSCGSAHSSTCLHLPAPAATLASPLWQLSTACRCCCQSSAAAARSSRQQRPHPGHAPACNSSVHLGWLAAMPLPSASRRDKRRRAHRQCGATGRASAAPRRVPATACP
jgi:hypothetical protein